MHARVMQSDLPAERIDSFVTAMRDQVIPRARKLPGFLGGYWLVDREHGKAIGVTLYKDAASLKASSEGADRIREEVSRNLGLPLPSFSEYEVVASVEEQAKIAA
jgi:hypothetical protein